MVHFLLLAPVLLLLQSEKQLHFPYLFLCFLGTHRFCVLACCICNIWFLFLCLFLLFLWKTHSATCITFCGCMLTWAAANSISRCCRSSSTTLTSPSSKSTSTSGRLLPYEFLFTFQYYLISLFHYFRRQQNYLIFDIHFDTIYVSCNLLICILNLSRSYAHFVKFLCVLFQISTTTFTFLSHFQVQINWI